MRLALASNEQAVYLAREVYSCGRLSARRDHPGGQCRAWSTRCSRILTCARSFSPLPLLALLCRSPLARRPKKPLPRLNRLLRTLLRLLTRPLRLLTRLLRKSLRLLRRTNSSARKREVLEVRARGICPARLFLCPYAGRFGKNEAPHAKRRRANDRPAPFCMRQGIA